MAKAANGGHRSTAARTGPGRAGSASAWTPKADVSASTSEQVAPQVPVFRISGVADAG